MPRVGKRGARGYKKRAEVKAATERARAAGRPLTAKDMSPDGIVRNGGARPGAGRPRGVPWETIQRLVERTGAPLDEVLALKSIPPSCLEDPAIITRIRDVVERAQMVFRTTIREALVKKGVGSQSVTALLGLARNTSGLEFDKQTAASGAGEPDLVGLEAKIDELLERLAKKARAATVPDVVPSSPTQVDDGEQRTA